MSLHARAAFDLWHDLMGGHVSAIYRQSTYYPPLFHMVAAPLAVFGGQPDSFAVANWLFLFLTMWAVWLIGRRLWGDPAGLTAAILVPACVYIAWMCLQPMTDLCLTACVCWTLWALIRAPDFAGRRAHFVGILIGLGMLAKWTYPFFTAVPILICLVRDYRSASRPLFFRRILIMALWALALAGPWYIRSLPHVVRSIGPQLGGAVAAAEGDPALLSAASFARYFLDLGRLYFQVPLVCFIAAGGLFLIVKWRGLSANRASWSVLLGSIFSGWAILTLIANKDPRYIMPVVPVIIVTAAGFANRKSAVAVAVALTFAMTGWNLFMFHPPLRRSTGVEEIADWLASRRGDRHVRAVVIPNEWTSNRAALDYALHRRDAKSRARRLGPSGSIASGEFVITLNPPNPNTGISPREVEMTRAIGQEPAWVVLHSFARHDGKLIEIRQKPEA